ncbi:MAG: acetyl-CoA carboxylase biotin carboxyl carrier protein, partial [Gammaproteobacteria bacterium]
PAAGAVTAPPAEPGESVVSPLVGTFYNAPSPQDAPYVRVGAEVGKGDTLCLIEAMKTFNQLDAEFAGIVRAIHKDSGDPVEYGEPLFVIERRDG